MKFPKNYLYYFLLGCLLFLSVFTTGKGTIDQVSSSVSVPSVGLVATWINDSGYNETVEIVNENSTHFILESYSNTSLPSSTAVTKDIWLDYTYLWLGSLGWPGWISVEGLTVGEYISLADEYSEVIAIENLTIPLGTFPVFVVNTTNGRHYKYHVTTGLMLEYDSGSEIHYLLTTNGDLSKDSDDVPIPFVGFRAVYLFKDVNGTIILNETMLVTGENATHYFVDLFADGSLLDQSFVSKLIWMDRVYLWTFISDDLDLGWPLWINVTDLTLGENVTIGSDSFQVVDKVHVSVPVGDFEVWNISNPLENSTYWYDVGSGLLIAYGFSDEFHYLDSTNAIHGLETTTTDPITTEPTTTNPLIVNSTTTSTEESTSTEPDATTDDGDSSTKEESTTLSITPGFSLPIVLASFGMFYWIYNNRKK